MQNVRILLSFLRARWPWVLAFLIAALLIVAFLSGYRVGPRLGLSRSGAVVFEGLPPGTDVYVDQVRRTSGRANTHTNLKEGNHAVIVDAPGYYPWNELVSISQNQDRVLKPILIHSQPITRILSAAEAQIARLNVHSLPSKETPIKAGCVQLYVSLNRVVAEPGVDCTPPPFLCSSEGVCETTVVYAPIDDIRSVLAMPAHDDALIVSVGKGVYAIEIDPHTPQFFAPIYTGERPRAVRWTADTIVIFDGAVAKELRL